MCCVLLYVRLWFCAWCYDAVMLFCLLFQFLFGSKFNVFLFNILNKRKLFTVMNCFWLFFISFGIF